MKVTTAGAGVLLPELRLALDSVAPGYETLVSHAHGDHVPWEARHVHCSRETADILAVRRPDMTTSVLPWREPTRFGHALVSLHPAGHILGAACILVEAGGERFLYTGDTKPSPGFTRGVAEYPEADVLVVESTFGLPIFRFPPHDALAARAVAFARETLDAGEVPVLLGYALGKSQEILAMLQHGGIPCVAHGAVWNLCRVYEAHGHSLAGVRPYEAGQVEGAALVVPGSFREHPMVLKLDARVAYCSGWAKLAKARVQRDVDALIPMSDHADYPELLDIVARVKPKRVLPNHGYADVFSHLLRKQGVDAQPLSVGHLGEDAEGVLPAAPQEGA